ncbi:multidrug resistance protein MdtA precursor [Variibacter gotjawalensis]|uniref:Multidrug resistance protein MdtA n=1 Tax=Variibacter gotjawalensis TaxID=1333996 RepID=A0A0S3PWP5_9BRAD|nr:efflux RND transporter periplasmic adaptor subunit [Variibacter gotjawalensis]NIK46164.1 RND family efflux transporter MFP subunit [Variibacter gotjawalensis]RZS48081.1 RND family efflux transporter MFP subunit [Variibacter gotjawalensis]BAT60338.1 multidrug resistance protein MdtA precursor [Variibacter gotjawalensis]
MARLKWIIGGVAVLAAVTVGVQKRELWWPGNAVAQAPQAPQQRVVPVETAVALKEQVPVQYDALGTVMPFASVAIKPRVDTEIVGVHFTDGSSVKEGDLLFTLDSRAIDAQIAQAEGVLTRDKASLEQAERDIKRYTQLLASNAGTKVSLENAQTQAGVLRGTIKSDEATIENLRVQKSYTEIRATINGRMSAANVKVGNFVRQADLTPLATINQIKPVYVVFGVPQRALPDVRQAMIAKAGTIEAAIPGEREPVIGQLAMIDNTVDPTTGMINIRARMNNESESLWPGTLVNVTLSVRDEPGVTVPSQAVQVSQAGSFVFVVKDGASVSQPVKVGRTVDGKSVIYEGLNGGETVVIDGQLQLANGTKVQPRQRRAGT